MEVFYIFTFGVAGIGWIVDVVPAYKNLQLKKKLLYYYQSDDFWKIKDKIKEYVDKCNELNDHIEDLKLSFVETEEKK